MQTLYASWCDCLTVSFPFYRPIQPLTEVFRFLKLSEYPVDEIWVGEAFLGEVLNHEPVALLEELDLWVVLGIWASLL